jgi:hypothetical protein
VYYQFNKKKDLINSTAVTFSNLLLPPNQQILIDGTFQTNATLDTNGLFRKKQLWQKTRFRQALQTTTLANVTVKAKQRSRIEELEAKYTSGMFQGGDDGYQFDFANDLTAQAAIDVFSYLSGRVAGLVINNTGAQTSATWRGSPTSFF